MVHSVQARNTMPLTTTLAVLDITSTPVASHGTPPCCGRGLPPRRGRRAGGVAAGGSRAAGWPRVPAPARHGMVLCAVSPDTCLSHHPRLPPPPAVQWCRRCPLGAGACLQRCLVGWCSSSSFKVSRKKLDREQVLIFSLTLLEQRHCQVSES